MNDPLHRLSISSPEAAVATQALIEVRLGVETMCQPEHPNETDNGELNHVWAVYFNAPEDADLDFLRPAILPPVE